MTSGVVQVSTMGQSTAVCHPSIDDALESLLSTPSSRWSRAIQRLLDAGVRPGRPATVTDGHAHVQQLVTALHRFNESAVTPRWSFMQVTAAAGREELAQILATQGIDVMLNSVHPEITWSAPVLTIGSDEVLPP